MSFLSLFFLLAPIETNGPFHPTGHRNITKDRTKHQVNRNKSLVGAGQTNYYLCVVKPFSLVVYNNEGES